MAAQIGPRVFANVNKAASDGRPTARGEWGFRFETSGVANFDAAREQNFRRNRAREVVGLIVPVNEATVVAGRGEADGGECSDDSAVCAAESFQSDVVLLGDDSCFRLSDDLALTALAPVDDCGRNCGCEAQSGITARNEVAQHRGFEFVEESGLRRFVERSAVSRFEQD